MLYKITFIKKTVIYILIFAMLSSCKSNDTTAINTSKTEIDLVTGINFIDPEAQPIASYGNPNIHINNQTYFYPNPVQNLLNISANSEISSYWIVTGNAQKVFQDTDFSVILNEDIYTASQLDNIAIQQSESQINFNNLQIDMTNLNEGYFKIFIKINSKIYWNNIYHTREQGSINDVINFWN